VEANEQVEALLGPFGVLGQLVDLVLEGDLNPRGQGGDEVQLQGPVAVVIRVQVDLPPLATGGDVDAVMILVVVEPPVGRMELQVGDERGKIDDGQRTAPRDVGSLASGRDHPSGRR